MLLRHRKSGLVLLGSVLFFLLLAWSIPTNGRGSIVEGARAYSTDVSVQETFTATVFLPLVAKNYPPPPPVFGVFMGVGDSERLTQAADAGAYWINTPAFDWSAIEPVRTSPPTYHWEVVNEQGLSNAAQRGLTVIARIHLTPPWARELPGHGCSRIERDSLDEFAQFLTALVNRYGSSPYNVRYWELDGEVDVDPSLVDPANPIGFWCWGDEDDDFYGGGCFAEMLQWAYPAIKAADPQAQVVIGGLLLACDPTHPPPGKDCKPSRFLEGVLRNGGGGYFDSVSFHGYPVYDGSLQTDEHFPSWEARGGVVLGKISFLREVMAAYGVNKPLMDTEGSLPCPAWNLEHCNPPTSAFYEAQADYVVWLFVRNWAEGVLGTTWFQFEGPGYSYSGMLDANQNPKPVYWAFQFMTTELGDASYSGRVTQYPNLRGYAFTAPNKRIWVLWSPDEQPYVIELPSGVVGVYDKYGNDITPVESSISISHPVYVEFAP
jgi:hypothetical protein